MNEIKSKRYPGLIKQAVALHAEVESKGWKLAEVIHEAVAELRADGFVICDPRNKERMTALRRVAADVGIASGTAHKYYYTWKKFSSPDKRDPLLTFGDHAIITCQPELQRALHEKRAQDAASPTGRRTRGQIPAVDPLRPYHRLQAAKGELRRILDSNIWDYSDREKALAYATELRKLAVELEIKFGGQQLQEAA